MNSEIKIWNGSGWNNYTALRELKTLQVGTRGLMRKNGVTSIEVCPLDSERPFGIAAKYYTACGENIYTQCFDQNDSANWIRERVYALLVKGVGVQIEESARKIARKTFIEKITAWRRNWDVGEPSSTKGANKLRAKIGALRNATGKHSRKQCWNYTHAVIAGEITYSDVLRAFRISAARATEIWNAANASRNK